jgi:aspartyl aminopeptidase
LHEIDNWAL